MKEYQAGIPDLTEELTFQASRSSGAGGQNVNKVNTRVELRFRIDDSQRLTVEQKEILKEKLQNRITKEGELMVVSQSERTQLENRKKAEERFMALVSKALKPVKKRKPTSPTRSSREKRLAEKKVMAEKKARRRSIEPE